MLNIISPFYLHKSTEFTPQKGLELTRLKLCKASLIDIRY